MLISLRHSGMSPLRAATQAALARRAARVSSTGGHPSHGLAAAIRARWRAWRRRSAAQVTLRCVRWYRDQGLRHDRKRRTPKSGRFRRRLWAVARSRARGSRVGFLHTVRERRPLDELTGLPLTPLRSVRCAPARSSLPSPAMPDAALLQNVGVAGLLDRSGRCGCGPAKEVLSQHRSVRAG